MRTCALAQKNFSFSFLSNIIIKTLVSPLVVVLIFKLFNKDDWLVKNLGNNKFLSDVLKLLLYNSDIFLTISVLDVLLGIVILTSLIDKLSELSEFFCDSIKPLRIAFVEVVNYCTTNCTNSNRSSNFTCKTHRIFTYKRGTYFRTNCKSRCCSKMSK